MKPWSVPKPVSKIRMTFLCSLMPSNLSLWWITLLSSNPFFAFKLLTMKICWSKNKAAPSGASIFSFDKIFSNLHVRKYSSESLSQVWFSSSFDDGTNRFFSIEENIIEINYNILLQKEVSQSPQRVKVLWLFHSLWVLPGYLEVYSVRKWKIFQTLSKGVLDCIWGRDSEKII